MTKATKRTFFYSAVAVFLLLSYIIVLYALGYKYSFSEGKFLRTGAISMKANTGANIYLDNKLDGSTSFFNNSYSINGLLPKNYKLKVEKENYFTWSKTVTVEEGLVTDFPSIFLIPTSGDEKDKLIQNIQQLLAELSPTPSPKPKAIPPAIKPKLSPSPSPEKTEMFYLDPKTKNLYQNTSDNPKLIASAVKDFQLSESKKKIFWRTSNSIWVKWLDDTNYQPLHKNGDKSLIVNFSAPIESASWFKDEDHIVAEFERQDLKGRPYASYKIMEIDTRGGLNIVEI